MNFAIRLIAGLIAGAVGAYGGLFALLSATGLDNPSWAPVAMLTGAALLGSVTVGLIAKLPGSIVATLASAATVVGAVAGLIIRPLQDGYEWMAAAGVAIAVGLVFITESMQSATAGTEEPERAEMNALT